MKRSDCRDLDPSGRPLSGTWLAGARVSLQPNPVSRSTAMCEPALEQERENLLNIFL